MNYKPNTVVQFCYSNMKGRKMGLSVKVTEFTTVPIIIVPVSGLRVMLSRHLLAIQLVSCVCHRLHTYSFCRRWMHMMVFQLTCVDSV